MPRTKPSQKAAPTAQQPAPAEPGSAGQIPPRRRQPHMALADGNESDHRGRRELAHQGDDRGPLRSR
jgi:hypothetical protein